MSDIAIKVENLSKQYRIGASEDGRAGYQTLRESLVDAVKTPFRRLSSVMQGQSSRVSDETIWALKDVSFEVERGEVVGIIGRNGAGKTTLLKILSRITEPTEGRAVLNGRVGSLLEVGTGFHPELTGRENIYLNGAILGMRRDEIERKFDEIVDFSGVEKFIDTPVKHYSSGMRVRLAFSVAAHLDPEILLIDEVLAVGDAAFQKKCLGKMGDVAKSGRTVLFVSHNMAAIDNLCQEAIWIENGHLCQFGAASDVISSYQRTTMESQSDLDRGVLYKRPTDNAGKCCITKVETLNCSGSPLISLHTGDFVVFRVHYWCRERIRSAAFTLNLATPRGTRVLRLSSAPLAGIHLELPRGRGYIDCVLQWFPLAAGTYRLGVGIAIPHREWLVEIRDLAEMTVSERDVYNSGLAPRYPGTLIAAKHIWRHTHTRDSESCLEE